MLISLNKLPQAVAYEAQWCMHEENVNSFSDSLCCSDPNGCSKVQAINTSPWDSTDYLNGHVDVENYVSQNGAPDALFSKTRYNMQVRAWCSDGTKSPWSPAVNDWLGCTVLGFCYSTSQTTCNKTSGLQSFQTEGNQLSDSITYSGVYAAQIAALFN